MTQYDLGQVVGSDGEDGNGIKSIAKTGTSGLVDTYTITFDDDTTTTFQVTNGKDGSDASVTIVTSWNSTTSDSKVPSEKLAKTSLDGKLDNALSSTVVSIASNDDILITDYSDSNKIKRVANILATQVKDSNAHSNIGSSANATQGTINSNIDTALSNKVSKSQTSGLLKNDGTVDTTSYSTFSGSYSDLTNKPSIPSSSSDLSDGSNIVKKSSTNGLLKNDGSVDTNAYITSSALPTIQTSWGSTTSDSKVASEKLIKSSLDGKLDNTIGSSAVTIASDDNIVITDTSDSNKVKKVANLLASQVKDGTAHSNIGSSANDTQAIINSDIDTALSNKVSKSSTDGVILNDGSIAQLKNIDGQELFSTYGDTDVITFHHYFRIYDFFIKKNWDYLNTRPTVDDYGLVWENGGYGLFNFTKNNVLPVEYEFEFRVTATSTISVYVNSTEIIDEGSSGTYTINIVYTNNTSTVKVGGTTVATLNTAITSLALSSQAEFTINGNYVYYDTDFDGCVRSSRVIEETALSNIGTSKGATQSEINSSIDTALGGKQATLVSGTNLKTINNTSLLGSGNIDISGGGSSVDIVTAWESTPSDSKVASEKLTKDTLDTKIAKSSTSGLVKNDGTIDTSAYITSSAISGMLTTSDIANNLTTTTTGKVLDASQGKALADLIGQAITYINQ